MLAVAPQKGGVKTMSEEEIAVTLVGASSPEYMGAQVSFDECGLWVRLRDDSWTFYPWERISHVAGFHQPRTPRAA